MSIGKNIRDLRLNNDMTQAELGEKIGVTYMAVSQWENDRAEPRMGAIERMSQIFSVPKSAIIDDKPRVEYHLVTLEPDAQDEECELLELFRKSTPEWKKNILMTARAAAGQSESEKREAAPE